jgi:hypothetical protein
MAKQLDRYIGDLPLDEVHMGTLAPFIEARKCDGVKSRTINNALKVVRRILNLAAEEWVDEFALTCLAIAPKIKLLVKSDLRKPYPLDWEEQDKLFRELPRPLAQLSQLRHVETENLCFSMGRAKRSVLHLRGYFCSDAWGWLLWQYPVKLS